MGFVIKKECFYSLVFLLVFSSNCFGITISELIDNFYNINSYSTLLRSEGKDGENIIHYYYKKPGFIKMVFVKPHEGATLVFNPTTRNVKLNPFKSFRSFEMNLKPDFYLITDPKGHTVDKSDLGSLLKNVQKLLNNGVEEVKSRNVFSNNRFCTILSVKGENGFELEGISNYLLWVDIKTALPVLVESYDKKSKLLEMVFLNDLKINVNFPENFFL